MGSPSLRFAGAEAEERRAREQHRAVRTAVSGGAVSPRQPQYMNIMIIFSGGVGRKTSHSRVQAGLVPAPPRADRLRRAFIPQSEIFLFSGAACATKATSSAPVTREAPPSAAPPPRLTAPILPNLADSHAFARHHCWVRRRLLFAPPTPAAETCVLTLRHPLSWQPYDGVYAAHDRAGRAARHRVADRRGRHGAH